MFLKENRYPDMSPLLYKASKKPAKYLLNQDGRETKLRVSILDRSCTYKPCLS